MRDHDDSRTVDHRSELLGESVPVYDESLGTPEPLLEDPFLRGCERADTEMLHRVMDGEDRSVSAGKRDETRIVVLVSVHDLGSPSTQLPSELEQLRYRGRGPNAAGDDK